MDETDVHRPTFMIARLLDVNGCRVTMIGTTSHRLSLRSERVEYIGMTGIEGRRQVRMSSTKWEWGLTVLTDNPYLLGEV